MNTGLASESRGFAELVAFCDALIWPPTEHDRRAFEAIFRCISPELSVPEWTAAQRLSKDLFLNFEGPVSQMESARQ